MLEGSDIDLSGDRGGYSQSAGYGLVGGVGFGAMTGAVGFGPTGVRVASICFTESLKAFCAARYVVNAVL